MNPLNLLYPPKCVLCGALLERGEQALCAFCRENGPAITGKNRKIPFLDGWTAIWYYEDAVRNSLLRYKFGGVRAYARSYGTLLAERLLKEHPQGFDLLTWIPISRRRRWKRGFDQSRLLAKYVGRALGMKPQPLLKKQRHNKPQSGISGEAHRRANVLGVYKVKAPAQIAGKRILLLDDIITTGATAGECARVLVTCGAKEVICGAVACARHDTKSK